jgi:ABC-type bacteriocin/lantibiotic exporter with double-glycine peptidase domain
MLDNNNLYETKVSENEAYLLDVLNNVDTIIHRGQVKKEMEEYSNKINETIDVALSSYSNINNHNMVMNIILYIILFLTIGYILFSFFNKTMDLTLFITFFTILAMYREKMFVAIQGVSDVVEFIGRAESVTIHFKDTAKDYMEIEKKEIAPLDLPFDVIQFENVSFKYKKGENMVLENANIMLHTDNKIIGIMGLSGGGKSTLVKLAIKLYRPDSGKIYIDGHDIEFIDLWPIFVAPDGLSLADKYVMSDEPVLKLHLNDEGYREWITVLLPSLQRMVKSN